MFVNGQEKGKLQRREGTPKKKGEERLLGKIGDEIVIFLEIFLQVRIFELSPIGGGGESYLFGELFAEVLIGLIPPLAIDFRKRDVGAFNELFGFADAQVVDVGIYRHTDFSGQRFLQAEINRSMQYG